ncbi:hypothetical protein [Jannaschia sp. M317]|uniref:hypothetical protein n=1 Tax=Jannaschia sp. M317 TaxID=2867011 RepID=UPI0021A2EF90|nr:hypothetical protein [Jannaschia sp. M317]UWQ18004.1 hypothetical protein K3551_01470 [Jannaschia sp. M317]
MRRVIPFLIAVAVAAPAWAERVVTSQEFEQMVHGKTLHFDRHGRAFGAEQYFTDKRVIWAFEGGQCQRGIWFENARGEICFVYDDDPAPQCWDFIEMPGGAFHARHVGDPPSDDLITRSVDDLALDCPLPDLGV